MGGEMTTGNESTPREPDGMSDEDRAAVFAAANAGKRATALRSGRLTVPTKFIAWAIVAVLALGFGGELAQHFFETYGKASPTTTTSTPVLKGTPTTDPNLPTLLSLQVFIGLKDVGDAVAPTFTLHSQTGHTWRLASHKGQVIVLSFFNAVCNDICPVMGAEIKLASGELGVDADKVDFVIVNTDPNETSISPASSALVEPGLEDVPSVTFLSGSVDALNRVWSAYGVRVEVGAKKSEVSHNNVLYFIGPNGNIVSYAAPFGTESKTGQYSLNAKSVRLYGRAIAETADSLVR
jgi:cytochrome oxidase Cu insertion factor (SCO1/SenC/PrrC family)